MRELRGSITTTLSSRSIFTFHVRPLARITVLLYTNSGTVEMFKLNPQAGQPLYSQLMQQIRHAIDTGALRDGDQLPGIRTLAEEIVVSHNTVAKAYSELEHEGIVELRHGSGAFIAYRNKVQARSERFRQAQDRVRVLIGALRCEGWSEDEIHRMFGAELFYPEQSPAKR